VEVRTRVVTLEDLVFLSGTQLHINLLIHVDKFASVDPVGTQFQVVLLSNKSNCLLQAEHLELLVSFVLSCLPKEELSDFFVETGHCLWWQVNLLGQDEST
jgi:hypothetical protein